VGTAQFGYAFPAIAGIQAGREFYISMCPLRLIPKIFLFDEEEMVPELRAQRILNKARIPEMSRYLVENPKDYVFSALTASIDADVRFEAMKGDSAASQMGTLHIPMEARFIINDGQHRRAAIERALVENPDLADETIAIVFFLDVGLKRCQQMFADLNRYAIRPSRSLGVLYDHRDDLASLIRLVVLKSTFFRGLVEMERSTLSPRSRRLFTLSALYHASRALLNRLEIETKDEAVAVTTRFWEAVAANMPEWQLVKKGKLAAGELRREYINSHGIMLQAIGQVGNTILLNKQKDLKKYFKPLATIDWARSNTKLWEGRVMTGGRISKGGKNVTLAACVIKKQLKIPLTTEEKQAERAMKSGR
jgi:DNA sulfur modification protein DndB